MENTAYSLHNLVTGYHHRGGDRLLSQSLCADLRNGELTCLLGANGSGKSTLIRTLAGFLVPLGGDVLLFGKPLTGYSTDEMARTVGVVLTDKLAATGLTAYELVAMGRLPFTGFWGGLDEHDKNIVSQSLADVGMSSFARRRLATLSDGELQKLMIAKALAQETPVILLDEPVAYLDFPSKVEVLMLLRRLAREQQKAVLLSIHDLELALQIADRLWLLDGRGGFVEGLPAALAESGRLDFFFSSEGVHFDRKSLQYSISETRI